MLNRRSGFSLIILIITVIILGILGIIIIKQTSNLDENYTAIQFINDLSIIEEKVEMLKDNVDFDSSIDLVGREIDSSITIGDIAYSNSNGPWYYIEESELPTLGVNKIKGDYLVNYETGKVVSTTGVRYKRIIYYTLDTILNVIDVEM